MAIEPKMKNVLVLSPFEILGNGVSARKPINFLTALLRDEEGQDLVEYSLLLAFIALAGAAAYIGMSTNTNAIWTIVNSRLGAANQSGS